MKPLDSNAPVLVDPELLQELQAEAAEWEKQEAAQQAALIPVSAGASELPREAVAKQLDQLVAMALAYRTGGELKALFEFTRRFPHIAPFNAMLLHIQNPGICYAMTADAWAKQYDRRVRQGARPYLILWTMGPVAFLFDLSDTEPRNPADNRVPALAVCPFPAKGLPPPHALPNLEKACWAVGVELDWRDLATNLAGSVRRHQVKTLDFFLQLNSKLTSAQKLGTLAHELAHVFCGHLGATDRGFWPNRPGVDLVAREFEAEAVAWLVTERMNLDIGSAAYLAGYLDPAKPLPPFSLDAVLKAVGKLEEMIRGSFRVKKKAGQAP